MCSPVEIIPCLARQSSSSELPQPCHKPALPLTLAAVLAEAKAGGGPAAPPGPALRWVLANAARHLVPELDTSGQSFCSIARPHLLSLEYAFKDHFPLLAHPLPAPAPFRSPSGSSPCPDSAADPSHHGTEQGSSSGRRKGCLAPTGTAQIDAPVGCRECRKISPCPKQALRAVLDACLCFVSPRGSAWSISPGPSALSKRRGGQGMRAAVCLWEALWHRGDTSGAASAPRQPPLGSSGQQWKQCLDTWAAAELPLPGNWL